MSDDNHALSLFMQNRMGGGGGGGDFTGSSSLGNNGEALFKDKEDLFKDAQKNIGVATPIPNPFGGSTGTIQATDLKNVSLFGAQSLQPTVTPIGGGAKVPSLFSRKGG
jgi:hypothetical protein